MCCFKTQVNITSQGRPYLGAALGSQEFVDQYVTKIELPQVTPIATLRRIPTSKIVTADLMSEVCHNVCVKPTLPPITGEALSGTSATTEDCASIDVTASGLWGGRFECAFSDVRIFNSHAPSNRQPHSYHCLDQM